MTTKEKIEAIMEEIQKRYDRSVDGDYLDDYDNGFRSGLITAKCICKEVSLQEPTEERQILVNCKCGNKYHMYGDKPFRLDIDGPLRLTCSVCGKKIDLYEEGKKCINKA